MEEAQGNRSGYRVSGLGDPPWVGLDYERRDRMLGRALMAPASSGEMIAVRAEASVFLPE